MILRRKRGCLEEDPDTVRLVRVREEDKVTALPLAPRALMEVSREDLASACLVGLLQLFLFLL